MIETGAIFEALSTVLTPYMMLWLVTGVVIGIVVGAIPGVGSVLGMSIVLPLTIPFGGTEANILLISIFSGAMYGSSISAIILRVPGTAAAAATLLDGYPITERGEPRYALALSAVSSALGGSLTMILLFLLIPFLTPLVLLFGSPQIFLVSIFGILMIGMIASQGSFVKGFTAGMFGILIMTIGLAPATPGTRFTLDSMLLYNGLDFVVILIGMFAIGEMLRASDLKETDLTDVTNGGSVFEGIRTSIKNYYLLIKSGLIGMGIGAIPGAGSSASNFFSYAEAVRSSSNPEEFGTGKAEGVIAAEASNNGTVAGSIMPVIAFGVPGSAATAVLLAGFILHGITPGPDLFGDQLDFTYSLIFALLLGNVLILFAGLTIVPYVGQYISNLRMDAIIPVVVVLSTIGAYTMRTNWIDLLTIFVFGVMAYYMYRYDYSVIAMVIGAVLASVIEVNLNRTLVLGDWSPIIFLESPVSIAIIVIMGSFILLPFLQNRS